MRALKGLEAHVGLSVVHPLMLEQGWELRQDFAGATGDTLYGLKKLYELYLKADARYSGRVTVPVLWDEQRQTMVSNESADIIRMLNSAFDEQGAQPGDYYPEDLREAIETVNETVYHNVNNGVYKAGFATSQEAYDEAATALFDTVYVTHFKCDRKRIHDYPNLNGLLRDLYQLRGVIPGSRNGHP